MLIPTPQNVRNITDFRKNPDSILEPSGDEPIYLFRGSEPKKVVLDTEKFSELLEMIEDYQDELLAVEIEADPDRFKGKVSFDQILKENKINLPKRQKNG